MREPQGEQRGAPAAPRLVLLGSGFAIFSLLKEIDDRRYDVTLISPRNHFIFTPLLPSTTVGTIEFRSIIEPIRSAKAGITYVQAECIGVDFEDRTVRCRQGEDGTEFSQPYDLLVIGVGGVSNTYGVPGVAEHAIFLKDLADARAIRTRIIDCFEQASTPGLPDAERKRLLQVVVVGGGPTGVEFAAEMHDFLARDLGKAFPSLLADVRVTLVEAADRILSTFDATLGEYTTKHFRRQNIDLRMKLSVVRVGAHEVTLSDGSSIPYGLLVWSTGLGPTSLVRSLPLPKTPAAKILIDKFCRAREGVYALGDCAADSETPLPATSQVAQQQGRYLARALNRRARGKSVAPFRYHHYGMLAYIGGEKALADLSRVKQSGFFAWIFWRSAYMTKLVGTKNKILVLFDWAKTAVFGRDVSRF